MGQLVRRVDRRWAWSRVIAYVLAVQLVVAVLVVRGVQARTDVALTRVGALLMSYAGATHQQAPRTLMLNGAEIRLSVGTTDDSVSDVLDHFHRRCEAKSGGLGRRLLELSRRARASTVAPVDRVLDGVLRVDDESRGVVACVDTRSAQLSIDELVARARKFVATGDIAQLGHMRFVTVERGDVGTVVVALWTEGPINIAEMFPATGDAPGVDLPQVPRPDRSRRIASAWEVGQRRSLAVYEVANASLAHVAREFRDALLRSGFRTPQPASTDAGGFVAERGDDAVMIAFAQSDATHTVVTISSLSDATAAVSAR